MSTQDNKPTALTGALVSVKGLAAPIVPTPPARSEEGGYLKAMTLKLDMKRYMQLKRLGLDRGKSSQELLVEAVDQFLRSQP